MKIVSHAHSRSALGYHFVFVTKRRRRVFYGKVEMALKRILAEISSAAGFTLEVSGVDQEMFWTFQNTRRSNAYFFPKYRLDGDHVHVFVTAPPTYTPGEIAKRLKGASSRRLRAIFPWLSGRIPGGSLWSPSYFASSVGAVSEAAVRRYVADQGVSA